MFIINTIRAFYIYLFSEWSGIPLRSKKIFEQYFTPSIRSLCDKDKLYKEGRDAGLFYSIDTLESLEFSPPIFEKKIMECEEAIDKEIGKLNEIIKKSRFPQVVFLAWALRQSTSSSGSWYGGVDEIYLLASYLFARKYGATSAQAVHWAHKWLPFQRAQFLPPIARGLRANGIGQFWSLVFYSIPRSLETFFTRPWVILATVITLITFIILWPIAGLRNIVISWKD